MFFFYVIAFLSQLMIQNRFPDVVDLMYVYWLARDRRLVNRVIKCMQKIVEEIPQRISINVPSFNFAKEF